MKPSDSNLSTAEFVKYFVTNPDVIRHFEWCLSTIQELESKESELDDAYCEINQLEEQNNFLEEEVFSLENEIKLLEDDIVHMRNVIAELERGKY